MAVLVVQPGSDCDSVTRYMMGALWLVCISLLVSLSSVTAKNEKNHKMFTELGLVKVAMSPNHYRKRLAVDARHYGRSDDSHMFIVKLPPNPHYYAQNYPHPKLPKDKNKYAAGFTSNGQPKKIYHWNIPVIRKLMKNRSRDVAAVRFNQAADKRPSKLPTYYIPAKPKKSLHKYFAGNGKPHSFYVIRHEDKPHYHKLLP